MKSSFNRAKFERLKRRQVRRVKIYSRHPFAVPFFTLIGLLFITLLLVLVFGHSSRVEVTPNSKIVIITHDGTKQIVPSNDKTVGALLSRLDIKLHSGDVVQPSLLTPIDQDDFRINIYRALPVEIINGGSEDFTYSAAATPRAIVQQAGVQVYAADYVTASPTQNFLQNGAIGEQVVIDRAIPIELNLYGSLLNIRTHASTVSQLINEDNIHLSKGDQVYPSENSTLSANEAVFITRNGINIQSVTKTIPMPVQTIYVSDLAYGTSSVVQQGSAGQETITYQVINENGALTLIPLQTVVTQPAITEIIDEGDSLSGIQGDMALAGISPSNYSYAGYIVSHESGWCPTKWQGDIGYCPAGFTQQYANDAEVGYGLCQSTPPDKMAQFGADWQTDPVTQLEWCNSYAVGRYGNWYSAYTHWTAYGSW